MPDTAMVMAAGLGLRMRALSDLPKPLIMVGGVSLLDRTLDWLSDSGIGKAVVNTHYHADLVQQHLAKRTKPKVVLSHEEELLETGGGIVKALPLLGTEPFFSTNSDVICLDGPEPTLKRMSDTWDSKTMNALLLLQPVERSVGYEGAGDFFLGKGGKLTRRGNKERAPYVFTGIQLLHPRLFNDLPAGRFSLNVLYDRLLSQSEGPGIFGLVHNGAWLHVGNPQGVTQAEQYLQQDNIRRVTQK